MLSKTGSTTKSKKGKNFVAKEERYLYYNFLLHVSQDPTTCIG
jgi:hypothetical protein